MARRRMPAWLAVTLIAVGLPLVAIPTLWIFVSLTAKPLHPDPKSVPTAADSAPSPRSAGAAGQARQIVLTRISEQNLPGVSVAVGVDGEIVWAEGFGYADLKTGTPVTPRHRFRIGTASAVLTSAAAGLLLETGRLKLDDEIQTYVPAFPQKQWPVTLRHLMGHTAGLPSEGERLINKHCEQPADALPYFAQEPLEAQPGARRRDSSYSWILASAAIQAAADRPFLAFLRERIFEPLGMSGTIPDPAAVPAPDDFPLTNMLRELIYDPGATRDRNSRQKANQERVTSYFTRFASNPRYGMHLMRPIDYSCYAGAGVFVATPSDLVRFGMAINGGKLLQPATVKSLQTSQRLASGEETGYGLGWSVKTITLAGKPTRVAGHDGDSLGGMVASLWTLPDHGIAVAVTSNVSFADTFALAVKVAEPFVESGGSLH